MEMSKLVLGIDNGISGSISVLREDRPPFWAPTPIKNELSYTKAKKFINRVDAPRLQNMLSDTIGLFSGAKIAIIERPMVNPTRYVATLSAIRALEATLIVLELLGIPYQYADSRSWQKEMLPSGLEGPELKIASLDVGKRLFPGLTETLKIGRAKDCDSLLMAEWARRKNL